MEWKLNTLACMELSQHLRSILPLGLVKNGTDACFIFSFFFVFLKNKTIKAFFMFYPISTLNGFYWIF